jgi:oligoribonuclease
MKIERRDDRLVWIDCEMTGLDPYTDQLLEIASIVTTPELDIVALGPTLAIHATPTRLAKMDAWNRRTHKKSGLIERIKAEGVPVVKAENATLRFLKQYCEAGTAPLCGNSVSQDQKFIAVHMPRLAKFLHYRIVDVTSIKVLAKHWYGDRVQPPAKAETHRALDDIKESIEELRYYRQAVFVK